MHKAIVAHRTRTTRESSAVENNEKAAQDTFFMNRELKIFSGNANLSLAQEIAAYLGQKLGEATVSSFSDGEVRVKIDENVRGADVFVVQSCCQPVNDSLMELLCISDALKRSAAKRRKDGVKEFVDDRQARKETKRGKSTANGGRGCMTAAGADRVLWGDMQAGQIQGFFNVPVDHLYALPVLLDYIVKKKISDLVVVSPDAGGVERARAFAKRLQANLAIIDKRREGPNQAHIMNIIGDVQGKSVLLLDDMIDTAGTIVQGAQACLDHGAREVITACTHAVLSGPALERLQTSCLSQVVVTNTIPLRGKELACPKLHQLSVAPLLGEAIRRIHEDESVSSLFA